MIELQEEERDSCSSHSWNFPCHGSRWSRFIQNMCFHLASVYSSRRTLTMYAPTFGRGEYELLASILTVPMIIMGNNVGPMSVASAMNSISLCHW